MTQPGVPDPNERSTAEGGRTVGASHISGGAYAIPTRIGQYQIKQAIGAGSFGTVYEAIQDQPRRAVALKLLRPTSESSERFRRFRLEAEVLGRLRHPGIAQVYEAGVHAGEGLAQGMVLPFIAMELLQSALPLTDFARKSNLSIPDRVRLFLQICHAIEHAHAHHVIHRDLKPSNIMVETGPDSAGLVKVIDFGVARWLDPDSADFSLATTGDLIVGTPAYMSPEQCSSGTIDHRTDQYALGVVLYQLLTGFLPHKLEGVPIAECARIIQELPPTRPSHHAADLAGDLETILLKTLQKEPDRRYTSVAALRDDLERWLEGRPISARATSTAYVASRRLAMAIRAQRGLFAVLLLALGFAVAYIFSAATLRPGSPLQRSTSKLIAKLASPAWPEIAHLPDVRVIGFSDKTDMPALARELKLTGVEQSTPKTFRALHGAMMKHLAASGARVVVFDIAFAGEPNGMEPAFAEGVAALKAAGIDTVVVMPTWHIDDTGRIMLDPTIAASGVRFGITTGNFHSLELWAADAYMRRAGHEAVPSLTVAAYAAARAPGIPARFTATPEGLEIAYANPSTAPYWLTASARAPDLLPLSGRGFAPAPIDDIGVQAGDEYGQYAALIPSESALTHAIIDYAEALRMPADQLRAKLGGRAVIIANLRSTTDRKARPNTDQTIAGPLINAAVLQSFLSGRVYTIPAPGAQYLLILLPSACAIFLTWRPRPAFFTFVATLLLLAACLALSLAMYRWYATLWNPVPAAVSLVVTIVLAARFRLVHTQRRASSGPSLGATQ